MASDQPALKLYNTLTRSKTEFSPIDADNVRMYVCGPTVYDFAHIGNARPVIVFDVLFRLLRHLYGDDHVTYVRNITDVDDKINARAARDFPGLPLNDAIRQVTEKTAAQFQADVKALGCLEPTHQPRATDNIEGMQALITALLGNGHAYAANGEVLFDTAAMPDYGQLSKRPLEDNIAGARVAVDVHKHHPADFVLWKQSSADEPGWDSPWGRGRPGWHIECSAMSERYLGQVFDIHGGGLDLIFPHHENEIAQSRCAHGTHAMANVWMHNGFVQVEGQKMSKSLGNFITINDLLETEKFGGRKWPGEVLRLAMLMTHYREPIDFTFSRLNYSEQLLAKWENFAGDDRMSLVGVPPLALIESICDDLSLVKAGTYLDELCKLEPNTEHRGLMASALSFLGILREIPSAWDWHEGPASRWNYQLRYFYRRGFADARERELFLKAWENADPTQGIEDRRTALADKDFARADTIRADLLAQGIQLMDYKDPETGERRTKWEVKR